MDERDILIAILKQQRNEALDALADTVAKSESLAIRLNDLMRGQQQSSSLDDADQSV